MGALRLGLERPQTTWVLLVVGLHSFPSPASPGLPPELPGSQFSLPFPNPRLQGCRSEGGGGSCVGSSVGLVVGSNRGVIVGWIGGGLGSAVAIGVGGSGLGIGVDPGGLVVPVGDGVGLGDRDSDVEVAQGQAVGVMVTGPH